VKSTIIPPVNNKITAYIIQTEREKVITNPVLIVRKINQTIRRAGFAVATLDKNPMLKNVKNDNIKII
jgi:hypothetical protein